MWRYETEITEFVNDLWTDINGDDERWKEMEQYYNNIVKRKLKPVNRNTFIALLHCKSFEEIAEEFTRIEKRKRPLTTSAIRKRAKKAMTIVKESLLDEYGYQG